MKRSTVPTWVVQYSLGYTIIFVPGCTAWTVGFPTAAARYPNSEPRPGSAGRLLQATNYYGTKSYGCYTAVGAVPTFYEPADSTPLGVLPHRVDPATCVRVKTQ